MIIKDKKEIKELKDNLKEGEAIVTFKIGKDKTVGIIMDQRGDIDETADYFVDWFKYGCIYSLFELGCSLCGEDHLSKAGIIKDFLEQLKAITKKNFEGSESDDDEDEEDNDKGSAIKNFKDLIEGYLKK